MNIDDRKIYYWLRHCTDYPCLFGVECPYAKYGDDGVKCKRRLMQDAADRIKYLSKLSEKEV